MSEQDYTSQPQIARSQTRDEAADLARFVEEIRQTIDGFLEDGVDRGDIKLVSRALKELRKAFSVMSQYKDRMKVTVFGSARTAPRHPSYQQAVDFGRRMAALGYMVITGAGPGIMAAAHDGAGRENSIGFNIVLPFEQAPNPIIANDPKLLNHNFFFTRKLMFVKESHALVLFPGGFGTLDEGFEVLTLLQTGKAVSMPIVMVDVPEGNYWEHFRNYLSETLYEQGMISAQDFRLFRVVHSVDDAIEEIQRFYRVYDSQRYVRGKLALRLKKPISDELFAKICDQFEDILDHGRFERGGAHPDERNDARVAKLYRLFIPFNRKSHGRLRQLIDLINREA